MGQFYWGMGLFPWVFLLMIVHFQQLVGEFAGGFLRVFSLEYHLFAEEFLQVFALECPLFAEGFLHLGEVFLHLAEVYFQLGEGFPLLDEGLHVLVGEFLHLDGD